MEWCPEAAMKAYLQTLHLYCRDHASSMDPKSMEFISAMAAGNRPKLMVEITSHGITSFTIALAVAAKLTGSRFICILPHLYKIDQYSYSYVNNLIADFEDVIEFVYTDTPFEVMQQHKMIDFAVVDCEIEHYVDILKHIDINPNRSTVVVHNVHHKTSLRKADGALFEQVVNKKNRLLQCVTLPFGQGMELTRITRCETRRRRRFHVIYEN
ncbi:hypothetical protein ACFE04_004188 [Oxalis oulophora]